MSAYLLPFTASLCCPNSIFLHVVVFILCLFFDRCVLSIKFEYGCRIFHAVGVAIVLHNHFNGTAERLIALLHDGVVFPVSSDNP